MPSQTTIALIIVALAVIIVIWRAYVSLKRSSCCGSCGCNLMSDKAKKKMLAKRKQKTVTKQQS
ncbi:hypothetical protein SAMN02745181_3169 [Rubritalea squalenifaciens DSM 18772]|uniref:Virus attachment protein p12 family protein n=2 Tax=Rubritalea TaxID=361050 RepID=A0A1M6PEV8_9BACT|nr:hypothetical protein [Rubritalea squalenifaciens]SHK06483.1 hypothetical protein SAMN02745181_3169 [Rubritalea squalenifaciens DSM 18772]